MREMWSCQCGKRFRSATAEAYHRHNFPMFCKRPKISEAGRLLLETIPDEWTAIPFFGDSRPRGPLIRNGFVETRKIDVTPDDWPNGSVVRVMRQEWRRTDKGRALF